MILFSDETLDWLNKGKYFYEQLLALFQKVVNKGGTLKFIHPSTRRRDRVTSSVEDWLPFYLTGAVEVLLSEGYQPTAAGTGTISFNAFSSLFQALGR